MRRSVKSLMALAMAASVSSMAVLSGCGAASGSKAGITRVQPMRNRHSSGKPDRKRGRGRHRLNRYQYRYRYRGRDRETASGEKQ